MFLEASTYQELATCVQLVFHEYKRLTVKPFVSENYLLVAILKDKKNIQNYYLTLYVVNINMATTGTSYGYGCILVSMEIVCAHLLDFCRIYVCSARIFFIILTPYVFPTSHIVFIVSAIIMQGVATFCNLSSPEKILYNRYSMFNQPFCLQWSMFYV